MAVAEPFEQANDVFLLASGTHVEHLAGLQITQDRVIAVSLAPCELINP
jgi:hypothetical protein